MDYPPTIEPLAIATVEGWLVDRPIEARMTEAERLNPRRRPGPITRACMWWLRRRGFIIAMLDRRHRLIRWTQE